MKVAHLSDLHVLDLEGVSPLAYANKRLLGYANIRFKRKHVHRAETVAALMRDVRDSGIEQVVVTGDLTNLALAPEFRAVERMLRDELGLPADRVSIVPGNHDAYVRDDGSRPFATLYADYTTSDLPELALPLAGGHFPFVRIRGPLAIIGLSSAVPRLPFVAAGVLGKPQLEALRRILRHPDVRGKTPVVLVHHPSHSPVSRMKALVEGLHDGPELEHELEEFHPALVLHGHLHRRIAKRSRGRDGLAVIGATSSSLHHEDLDKMAGYNVYTFDDDGRLTDVSARVFHPADGSFHTRQIPEGTW